MTAATQPEPEPQHEPVPAPETVPAGAAAVLPDEATQTAEPDTPAATG